MGLEPERNETARISTAAAASGVIEAARIDLIGLDDIEAAAGVRWPRLRDDLRTGTIRLIQNLLREYETVHSVGDAFRAVFADVSETTTRQRCDEIHAALIAFYLEEDGLADLRVRVTPETITPDLLTSLPAAPPRRALPLAPIREGGPPIDVVPLWSLRDGRVGAELCAPVLPTPGARHVGYNADFLLSGVHNGSTYLNVDMLVLDTALKAGSRVDEAGKRRALGLQVHATTMRNRRSRESYLSLLSEVTDDLPSPTFITIAEIERGTPMMSIMQWVGLLRTRLDRVVLDFHYADHALGGVRESGAWAVSMHLPIQAAAQKPQYCAPLIEQMKFWTKALHGRGLRLIVYGFHDAAFAAEAARLGVDLGAGEIGHLVTPPLQRVGALAPSVDHAR